MSAVRWNPQDAELDELARSLPPQEAGTDEAEQNRTRVLAGAATVTQQSPGGRTTFVVSAAFVCAAAAAALVWFVGRERDNAEPIAIVSPALARDAIVASAGANFERVTTWPDASVRVHEGRVSFDVGILAPGEHYRVLTADAQIEIRGTRFLVEVHQDRLTSVLVDEGRVELTMPGRTTLILEAGQRWSPPRTAQLDPVTASPGVGINSPQSVHGTSEPATRRPAGAKRPESTKSQNTRHDAVTSLRDTVSTPTTVAPSAGGSTAPTKLVERLTPPVATPVSATPGETEFRRGWSLLRGGDPGGASKAFASACNDLGSDALSEDACYWAGVASKRAGQSSAARDALTKFIARFPSSSRAMEASALLGWLLYESGSFDAAEVRFKHAARDRTPKVQASAARGLEAIKRRREASP